MRSHSFAPDEWYHCYNRGVEKRTTFGDSADFRRFQSLMYTGNATKSVENSRLRRAPLSLLIEEEARRGDPLVHIGAYALMPNHFHLVLKEIEENGVSRFMQKLLTGYTMYFNKRYERNGPLFAGVFKSKHVSTDRYFQHLVSYVHFNPASLVDPAWKVGKAKTKRLEKKLLSYPYSSLMDIAGSVTRLEKTILSEEIFDVYRFPGLTRMVTEAHAYYQERERHENI